MHIREHCLCSAGSSVVHARLKAGGPACHRSTYPRQRPCRRGQRQHPPSACHPLAAASPSLASAPWQGLVLQRRLPQPAPPAHAVARGQRLPGGTQGLTQPCCIGETGWIERLGPWQADWWPSRPTTCWAERISCWMRTARSMGLEQHCSSLAHQQCMCARVVLRQTSVLGCADICDPKPHLTRPIGSIGRQLWDRERQRSRPEAGHGKVAVWRRRWGLCPAMAWSTP